MWKKWKKKLSSLLILTLIVSMIAPDLSVIASSADVIVGTNGTVYDANYEPDIIDEDAEYYDEDDEEYEDYCEDYEVDSVYALASDSNASPSNATRATGSNATRATSSNAGRLASGSNWDPERCAICGTKNCTTAHLYCTEHGEFDCMESHTPVETEKPITEVIIPETPTLTDGADVSIVDAEGEAVTEETGFVIPEGTRVSLSAFLNDSTISADSYQWQICYDTENDLWTDIQGQDNQGMIISLDLMNSISDPTIRCEVVSDEETLYSEAIPIIVEEVTEEESGEAIAVFRFARAASNVEAEEETVAAVAETGEQTTDTYSIVINYVFENGKVVANPYTATFGAGASYEATVTHPTVMGYLPYVGKDAETSTRIDLNIENMQEDVTYTVTYKPTNVDYTVIHYLQNVHNDNYTIEETVTTQGLTASTVPEVAKTYEGFYALLYEKPEIAADGSTVVEVYYDRYYYLMNFDLDGGYGVEPIYARYGAPVSVGTPTKAGYEFLGWDKEIPSKVPMDGGTYTAKWEAGDANYTIVYWLENANDNGYTSTYTTTGIATSGSIVNSSSCADLTASQVKDIAHFTRETSKDTEYTIAGDGSTVVNVYYSRTEYTITFKGVLGELTCTKTEHEHSKICCRYGGTSIIHWSHDINCCKLSLEAHTHNSSCYETVDYSITAKYDADISSVWSTDPIKSMLDDGYVFQSSLTDKYYSFLEKMPGNDITMTATKWSGNKYTWYYYLEVLPGMNTTDLRTRIDNGKTYYEYDSTTVYGNNISLTYAEDYYPITGFTQRDNTVPSFDNRVAYLYYTRNSYEMTFINYSTEVTDKGGTYLYDADISGTDFTPSYPETLESNSYEFDGWYTSPYFGDTKFDFTNATMPANNLILYANWTPKKHKVNYYLTWDSLNNNETIPTEMSRLVQEAITAGSITESPTTDPYSDEFAEDIVMHGCLIGEISAPVATEDYGSIHPRNGYEFIGWFYLDENGNEKAFAPSNMPVTQDLNLYGKWSSIVLKEYEVYFKIQGTDTEIADPITGFALAGTTKTFEAKGGTDLYVDYQEGYFPLTQSHSLTLDIENDANNTFTFWYEQKDAVPYTVYYVAETLKDGEDTEKYETITRDGKTYYIIAKTYTNSKNRKAVVTEKFKTVAGYMPDAYQKRLVVNGSDDAVNEIIFYYTVDDEHAYYKVTHYTQNTDGETWTEYQSNEYMGTIGAECTASPLSIDGFTWNEVISTVSGNLTTYGLELKLYYTRNSYPYKVRYWEQDSGKQLAEPKLGSGLYGQVIFESAIDIEKYTAVDPTSQTLTIKIETDDTAPLNIITFYYKKAVADLTITKTGEISKWDEEQSFIFHVTGPNGFSLDVVINGTGSAIIKDLPVGTYVVEEITDWSWRYNPGKGEQDITLKAGENTVTFDNTREKDYWLSGDSVNENQFTVKSKEEEN